MGKRNLISGLLPLLLVPFMFEAAYGLDLNKTGQSIVDEALTIDGRWGTFINGKSYQQMPLDTYQGWQYITYYDQQRQLSVGRRKLPDGAWELIHFEDYLFEGVDNHNVAVLGIGHGDGTIHLAFDHHGEPLNYRVSQPGVATDPENVKWDASLFSDVDDRLKQGYPQSSLRPSPSSYCERFHPELIERDILQRLFSQSQAYYWHQFQ